MSRYVARHPKTGEPLYSEKDVEIETTLKPPISKWDGLELSIFQLKKLYEEILPLAKGEINEVVIDDIPTEYEAQG